MVVFNGLQLMTNSSVLEVYTPVHSMANSSSCCVGKLF